MRLVAALVVAANLLTREAARGSMRIIALLFVAMAFAGCLTDDDPPAADDPAPTGTSQPSYNVPYLGELTGFDDGWVHEMHGGGQGIWIHNDLLYWTNGGDLYISDVSDPANITDLGSITGVGARDVDVFDWDGKVYAVLAGSGRGMHLIDVTDPTAPELVTTIDMPSAGVHNLAAVNGTPYVYSSGGSRIEKRIDVADFTDPYNPVVTFFPIPLTMDNIPIESDGCHDISVRYDLKRAYCAGGGSTYTGAGGETFIWDISEDPRNPVWLGMLDDPRIKYHHQALVNDEGDILIVDDEHIIADNCVREDVGLLPGTLDPQIPTGAAWVWDISDESAPVLKAIVQNPQTFNPESFVPNVNCGSHFGDIVLGQEAFIMGWYSGGTMLVSFEDPENPEILDIEPANSSHWDARYWRGHVYHSGADLVVTPLI